jgi:hypothetical protein
MVLNVNPKQDEIGDLMMQVTHSKKIQLCNFG